MTEIRYRPLSFADLQGWDTDDVGGALEPFSACSSALRNLLNGPYANPPFLKDLASLSYKAAELIQKSVTRKNARSFFEDNFTPHAVEHDGDAGLLTGYFEPVLQASRIATDHFTVPIYRRPEDLLNVVCDEKRGTVGDCFTHMQKTGQGLEPFADRAAIEQGALTGRGLELCYLEDAVDAFFLHVQGSGLLILADGSQIRIGYNDKNGHPYTSIGRYVIDNGFMQKGDVTLAALKSWLKADPDRGRHVMWQNKSFIFFKERPATRGAAPYGVADIPLTAGRSLALDSGFYSIGLPIFVSAPTLDPSPMYQGPLQRLLVAQDAGSAIKGPERGDFFYGTGDLAGALAGCTKHDCNFFVLLPKQHVI